MMITIFMLGLARVLYARVFQEGAKLEGSQTEGVQFGSSSSSYGLPPAQSIPVSGFGSWRAQTGEIVQSPSVTERTTKSLDKEQVSLLRSPFSRWEKGRGRGA